MCYQREFKTIEENSDQGSGTVFGVGELVAIRFDSLCDVERRISVSSTCIAHGVVAIGTSIPVTEGEHRTTHQTILM
jgi:hypothetical protein